jgi:hypothetical protein
VIDGATNKELIGQWLSYIEDQDTKRAFQFLVGIGATSNRFTCHAQWKGDVRDFRFLESSEEQPHSFITNRHWLLFYFRPPAVRACQAGRSMLERDFDTFQETPAGEWTVRLRTIDDIAKLPRHISWNVA